MKYSRNKGPGTKPLPLEEKITRSKLRIERLSAKPEPCSQNSADINSEKKKLERLLWTKEQIEAKA